MAESLSDVATQVNLLYASCNAISQTQQTLLNAVQSLTNNDSLNEAGIAALSSVQESLSGSIDNLNTTLTSVLQQVNRMALTVTNNKVNVSTAMQEPETIDAPTSGTVSFVSFSIGAYKKILFFFDNYLNDQSDFTQEIAFANPFTVSPFSLGDVPPEVTVSPTQLSIPSSTNVLNGYITLEGF